jgi:hypothetical protein
MLALFVFPPVAVVRALHPPTTKVATLLGQGRRRGDVLEAATETIFNGGESGASQSHVVVCTTEHKNNANNGDSRLLRNNVLDIRGGGRGRGGGIVSTIFHGAIQNPILVFCKLKFGGMVTDCRA